MSNAFELLMGADRTLRGSVFPARKQSRGTIIVCHGYKGFKDWGFFPYLGHRLSEHYDAITFNFTFNGVGHELTEFTELDKFAKNTYSHELEDLQELISALKKGDIPELNSVNQKPLFLLGHSRGAGDSLIFAMDNPGLLAGVISWNGITNVDLYTDQEKQDMRSLGRAYVLNGRTRQQMPLDLILLQDLEINQERFDILERAKGYELITPCVLIQGENDGAHLRRGSAELVKNCPYIKWHIV
ncbi:MAG: alpha/beta hydrolase, partial [Gorillibacterium sp.]|nr:alpha/beta hydrolase [Gorillibacterium sp.]